MKAESTILVSLATGVASVCLLLTCLNMYMLNNMRTTLKSLDGRLADAPGDAASAALIADKQQPEPATTDKDELIAALYRHLDHQNNQIAQYEMKLQHLADLHEHRSRILAEQEAIRQNHLATQHFLEKQKRRLAKKLTKFQLEKQAHEHQREIEEYERQLHRAFDQMYELQRQQEEHQTKPWNNVPIPVDDYPSDPEGTIFMVQHEMDFPFSPLDLFLTHIFGPPTVTDATTEAPAMTVSLETVRDADNTDPEHPDFAEEPMPVEDADVLADSDDSHVVVNRVLPDVDADAVPTTTPAPVLPTPAA